MRIVFKRTGEKRYAIEARRDRYPDIGMDPAPGYDPDLPHDLAHFVVEAELPLTKAVFGQLAAGGTAGTFGRQLDPPKHTREAARQRRKMDRTNVSLMSAGAEESAQSERAAYVAWYEWLARSSESARRERAKEMVETAGQIRARLGPGEENALNSALPRICDRLEAVSRRWRTLGVGESLTEPWPFEEGSF